MKHIIMATAGHVDHGKTALIKALTGQDTDRLKEEKARGISIDLGFAHLALADDIDVSIVDVPGHERFLKNMLAGVGGIDMALLIIAADEGAMPQTHEHLAMLDLYGVQSGIIVITKSDKVDGEWLSMVAEEARSIVKGTFLASAPLVTVSAVTGAGLEQLRTAITIAAAKLSGRDAHAPFRMWIDRVFTVKGQGTVVTGSILSGTVTTGETLLLAPPAVLVKARGIESHGLPISRASAGQRAAINLSGEAAAVAARGLLLTSPERSVTSQIWDAAVDWREAVKSGTRIRLHLGTGEWIGRVRLPRFLPPGIIRLSLEKPLPGGCGEKGILRLYSPAKLLGGITLLAPAQRSQLAKALADAARSGDWRQQIRAIVAAAGKPLEIADLKRSAGYIADAACDSEITAMLTGGEALRLGDSLLAAGAAAELAEKLQLQLQQYHKDAPEAAGMGREELRQRLGLEEKWFEHLLRLWQQRGLICVSGAAVALPQHLNDRSLRLNVITQQLDAALKDNVLQHIDTDKLAEILALKPSEAKQIYDSLLRSGELVRLGNIIVYSKTLQYNVALIQRYLRSQPGATAAQLKDVLQTTRKFAIPVLEYCDMNKYTMRVGELRKIGPRIASEIGV